MAIADIKDEKSRLVKRSGQVFTPLHIVTCMLDYCGYVGDNVLRRHIIDNSCGDGAFLKVISTSFSEFVKAGTSRSPQKLKPLHGAIAEDLARMLGDKRQVHDCGTSRLRIFKA